MAKPVNKLKTNAFKEKEAAASTGNKKSARSSSTKKPSKSGRSFPFKKLVGIFFIFVAIYLALALTSFFINWFNQVTDDVIADITISRLLTDIELNISNWTGNLGAFLAQFLAKEGFGVGSYYLVLILFAWGIQLGSNIQLFKAWTLWKYGFLSLIWLPLLLAFIFRTDPLNVLGGVLGHYLHIYLNGIIGTAGIIIALTFTFAAFVILQFNLTFSRKVNTVNKNSEGKKSRKSPTDVPLDLYNTVEYAVENDKSDFQKPEKGSGNTLTKTETKNNGSVSLEVDLPLEDSNAAEEYAEENIEFSVEPVKKEETRKKGTIERQGLDTQFDPTLDLPDYKFPHLDLLTDYGDGGISVERSELESNKKRIVETLANYSIGIEKIKATIGPTVTLYEIVPSAGVRIARIKGLEDDIALSLSAIGIRIIAPIPGKGTVGIEVPNQKPEIVSMRTIIGSEKFSNNTFELPFGLGKTISNESFVADLAKMPHILMAGATGQGKSVGLNAIIASLLYCKHPAELKFVMVDPKKVELSLFSRIERHYLAKLPDSEEAIITDTRKVVRTLNSLSIEMDNRYELLKDAQVRNVKEYNVKFRSRKLNPMHGHRFLPYIVLVVDEFADLIMTAGKEIESPITRLAQLARAVGIHLIIATQRPSVNIITGTIKANFPARIAFRVISGTDSRTILDTKGADQLIGRGDMLLSTGSDLVRLQCAFIDTPEVERLTEFIGSQRGYPDAYHLPEFAEEQDEAGDVFDATERDELFEDAARIIVQTQQGSTSLLQRKLKLGYNRAGRIIDQLEAAGIVGPFEGSKAREVKVANELALEQFLKDLDLPKHE
ncbi:MAG: segregation ATPase FtsK/SpoIIIE, family [Bacteroidales bacterium]|jgi:S-DNA-T family DNA segregation ATPase FtsK/SpoIIIE|nr:segregation ATPase FtsK/SpoIIIE, family [Bacteroidales bacterium]